MIVLMATIEAVKRAQDKYRKNNPEFRAIWAKNARERWYKWFDEVKAQYSCIECGESHPACIDFHHRNPEDKEFEIGKARQFKKERILAEIAKCDPLCANCHRKLHWRGRDEV